LREINPKIGKENNIIRHALNSIYQYWKHENRLLNYYIFHIIFSRVIEFSEQNKNALRDAIYIHRSNSIRFLDLLAEPFDLAKWNNVKNVSSVHKLTYKRNFSRDNSYTFYDALLEEKLF
jgi:predicted nucleic acid-binding protein